MPGQEFRSTGSSTRRRRLSPYCTWQEGATWSTVRSQGGRRRLLACCPDSPSMFSRHSHRRRRQEGKKQEGKSKRRLSFFLPFYFAFDRLLVSAIEATSLPIRPPPTRPDSLLPLFPNPVPA